MSQPREVFEAMAINPACQRSLPLLSAYIDGELSPAERGHLERHLAACPSCTSRVADLRAESGLIRVGLEMAADEVDFTGFAQKVLARVTPEKPSLRERWRLSLSEFFTYQRGMMVTSLATAAAVLLVAAPVLLLRGAPEGYAQDQMQFQAVSVADEARVKPVVFQSEGESTTIIWYVDQPQAADHQAEHEEDVRPQNSVPGLQRQGPDGLGHPAPKGGEL
jgi:anti-sigma factor RsiW